MRCHHPYSGSDSWPRALRPAGILACVLFLAGACNGPQPSTPPANGQPAPAPTETAPLSLQQRHLQELTDSILQALATYDYEKLTAVENGRLLAGRRVAQKLLGLQPRDVVIEQWFADRIRVQLLDQNRAVATVPVTYRPLPNRAARTDELTFRYLNTAAGWQLDLDSPS